LLLFAYRDKKVVGVFVRFSLRRFTASSMFQAEGSLLAPYYIEVSAQLPSNNP
jgi:hypothetical protein